MQQSGKGYKRIVVKVGSSLFYSDKQTLDFTAVSTIAQQAAGLAKSGKEVVMVSSGAIALGMHILGLKSRPKQLSELQAVAAMGQNELMDTYRALLQKDGLHCAQVLLTAEDLAERSRYLNAKNTLLTILRLGAIPIINENDTVSTEEIKFGDNDRLSALVASLISADLLLILTDVDGLLEKDRKTVVAVVDEITPRIKTLACPTDKRGCVGGMVSKLEAAKVAVDSGIPCVIANGRLKETVVSSLRTPGSIGTIFLPKVGYLQARRSWLAFGTKPKGKIIVDEGAKNALLRKKSLLCVGILSTQGSFECTDVVSIVDKQNCEFARGRVKISSRQLEKVKGSHYHKEAVHCDDIVILS